MVLSPLNYQTITHNFAYKLELEHSMGQLAKHQYLKEPNVVKHLSQPHGKYVVAPADKAPNNIFFVCKSHYIDCLIKESGIANFPGNLTYFPTTHLKEEVLCLFCVPLEIQPKIKKWIYCLSTRFLNYTNAPTNRLYCWVC